MTIFVFPTSGIKGIRWSMDQSLLIAESNLTGFRRAEKRGERRRSVSVSVSARRYPGSHGQQEALKKLIKGGEHYVRLSHRAWTDISGSRTGMSATDTTKNSLPALSITSGPINQVIARAGEFVLWSGETLMLMDDCVLNSSGNGTVIVDPEPSSSGTFAISFGVEDVGTFEAVTIPSAPRPVQGDFMFDWEFLEVLPSEYAGHNVVSLWP